MQFQKGNELGFKGRPVGSKNKATDEKKFELQYCNIAMGACSKSAKVLKTLKLLQFGETLVRLKRGFSF